MVAITGLLRSPNGASRLRRLTRSWAGPGRRRPAVHRGSGAPSRQLAASVRLRQEKDVPQNSAIPNDRMIRVAGGEQHPQRQAAAAASFRQAVCVHFGHDDIGEQADRNLRLRQRWQELQPHSRPPCLVAKALKLGDDIGPDVGVVFDAQDGFGSALLIANRLPMAAAKLQCPPSADKSLKVVP